jgi:organic hydroperoxide reductase OsmC/OhrA
MEIGGIMESTHAYRVTASSTTPRSGLIEAEGIEPVISFGAPPEFLGEAGHWTPEHFFVAAVASCYVSTFSGMSLASKFEYLSLELKVEGILGKDEGGWRFTKVLLRPTLHIVRPEDEERGNRLLQKAEKNCLVGRSIACPTALESEIRVEQVLAVR